MIKDLAFLYLDLPKFPVTEDLILRLKKIVNEEGNFKDNFRNCRHIPIYVTEGKNIENKNEIKKEWSKQSEQLPEVRSYIENNVLPWSKYLGRIVIICTKPKECNPTHIDCSRKNFDNNTLEHKFRVVINGQTNNLYFNGKDKNHYISENLKNHPFIMSGCWPHTMENNDNDIKFTLAMGAPWDADDLNKEYKDLISDSYIKYKNSYISKKDMKMPKYIDNYFSKK